MTPEPSSSATPEPSSFATPARKKGKLAQKEEKKARIYRVSLNICFVSSLCDY